jgi:hypothetical protein
LRGEEVEASEKELVFWEEEELVFWEEEELDSCCAGLDYKCTKWNYYYYCYCEHNDCCENYRFSHSFDVRKRSYKGY